MMTICSLALLDKKLRINEQKIEEEKDGESQQEKTKHKAREWKIGTQLLRLPRIIHSLN